MLDKLFNKLSSRRDDKYIEIKNTPKKYVIIGASAAGINAGKVLRKLDPNLSLIHISYSTEPSEKVFFSNLGSSLPIHSEIVFSILSVSTSRKKLLSKIYTPAQG